jgi:pyridoxine 5-phosphate synthase
MADHLRLGVNIDHVATIRNARGGVHPDPVRAAILAQEAGADGITAHLREDRRHISDKDIERLKAEIALPLNLEMAPTWEMLEIALCTKPNAACIVPEKRQELTTEGGLDVIGQQEVLKPMIDQLKQSDIRVSLFIDPDIQQAEMSKQLGADIVEFHTGTYCEKADELEIIQIACKQGDEMGLECHAGHGLSYDTVKPIAAIPQLKELNIGHFLIGESMFSGLKEAIQTMRQLMDEARA